MAKLTLKQAVRGYTHFMQEGHEYRLFTVDSCEGCQGDCEGANSIKVSGRGVNATTLAGAGLAYHVTGRLPEMGHSETLGLAVCPPCYDEGEAKAA